MAFDLYKPRGGSEPRALSNIEQLLDDHRKSIVEVFPRRNLLRRNL
jgi:hypothetical protein